ncbi:MAG: hypothetical protein RL065_1553, partial [Bacteroidota bacterium]|jgi:hypothetical protein
MKKSNSTNPEVNFILKSRFEKNLLRHPNLDWKNVEAKLLAQPAKLKSLQMMEDNGGEPDVVSFDKKLNEFIFMDCSAESPVGRRSLCYDKAALDARKENKPKDSAMNLAKTMGVEILNEEQYRFLQTLGNFDLKTSSWIQTPEKIRKLGGALFCDKRFDTVFTYHNGAESYYSARGFRAMLKV